MPASAMKGLAVLTGIVALGLLSGAGAFHCARSVSITEGAELEAEVAAAPRTLEQRLELWQRFGAPQIHHRLTQVARFSPEMPWLVTHAVAGAEGAPPEIWGIDCAALSPELTRVEGARIVVDLPHPRALGRASLTGDMAGRVPIFAPDVPIDARARLAELALYLLEGIPRALERDIEGASLEIRVAAE